MVSPRVAVLLKRQEQSLLRLVLLLVMEGQEQLLLAVLVAQASQTLVYVQEQAAEVALQVAVEDPDVAWRLV